jgi:hypothetical protein
MSRRIGGARLGLLHVLLTMILSEAKDSAAKTGFHP